MKWEELIKTVGAEPVFASALLLAGSRHRSDVELQLSRWVKAGKLCQLRRGLYMLAGPYRRVEAHPFLIANRIRKGSYISLQSAMAHWGLIPDYTPVVTSVTTGRPGRIDTSVGTFSYQHVKKEMFRGYSCIELGDRQTAFVAGPEKSLLDLVYLTPGSDDRAYLQELRLQNTEGLDRGGLLEEAERSGSRKLSRAARAIIELADEQEEYREL